MIVLATINIAADCPDKNGRMVEGYEAVCRRCNASAKWAPPSGVKCKITEAKEAVLRRLSEGCPARIKAVAEGRRPRPTLGEDNCYRETPTPCGVYLFDFFCNRQMVPLEMVGKRVYGKATGADARRSSPLYVTWEESEGGTEAGAAGLAALLEKCKYRPLVRSKRQMEKLTATPTPEPT